MPADSSATSRSRLDLRRGLPRPHLRLFAISFSILFFELACIRWFASTVIFLTFFTNVVLLACVLGMSAGCLAAPRRFDLLETSIPLTLVAVLLAQGVLWGYQQAGLEIRVGQHQAAPEQVYFGTEPRSIDTRPGLSIELLAGGFYALLALVFVGPGQALGRAFRSAGDRLGAYATNLAGSLAGIAAFSALAFARASPAVWFAAALVPLLWFMRRRVWLQAVGLAALLALVEWAPAADRDEPRRVVWSPYYKVAYEPGSQRIETNNIGHQQMLEIGSRGAAYVLPYLLYRDAGGPPHRAVLILGAGSGNDVAAALAHGATHVDAVEIDPVLLELGEAGHPDRPYSDPRVAIHEGDGRSFVRQSRGTYDQVTYALVDSLVLHSGYSSLRLESFLFTEEAFREIKARLAPEGVFVMYNYFRQGFVVGRLAAMAERVFGTRPIVLSLPYQARITPGQAQGSAYTIIIVGRTEAAVAAIRRRFARGDAFWMNVDPRKNEGLDGFRPAPPESAGSDEPGWRKIAPAFVETAGIVRLPTDQWPFLYLRRPSIPVINLRGIAIMLAVSIVLLGLCVPWRTTRPAGQMFFLGAGFMLLETRGVVQLALLFGSTWMVNSIVFAAVLLMVLLSNLCVFLFPPRRTTLVSLLLLGTLALELAVPASHFLGLPPTPRVVTSCALIFAPIFFAGVLFATAFRASARPDADLGWNIAGVVLGGLSEYLSLVVGFDGLLILALVYYVLAALLARPAATGAAAVAQ